jgi:hypothetical protein
VNRRFGVIATAGVLAVTLALVLAACGGSGDSGGVASLTDTAGQTTTNEDEASGSTDPEQAALEYTQCMRENGVDMADPGANGELRLEVRPGERQKVEKAQRACEHLLEKARPKLSEEQQNAMQDALLAFAKCMRKNGIDMPDPVFGEGGKVTQRDSSGRGLNPDDPKFKKAEEACSPILDEGRRKAGLPEGRGSLRRSGGDS